MSPLCDCCGEHISKLYQQVSVMRKEIKNLRQMLDSACRAHRKHMASLQSAVSKIGLCDPDKDHIPAPPSPAPPQTALERGNIQTVPIGYISSCFSVKNGTPRQPTICGPSRAELRIQQSIFNNPGHALVGLEHWCTAYLILFLFLCLMIIFVFHKNGHLTYKAKVKPPRLNGQRVGVYSTRSPHRPNALGLTLAKLDKIVGECHDRPKFQFLCSPEEAAAAIRGVLSADPRSVYRRTRCRDRLFFFTIDTADITCWFGQGFAEVLQVRPVTCNVGKELFG
uniref:TsaA-like domain-containing protein n=1 Tax=Monopterus albus TaxID=43700 RepID=A0A3Q3IKG6_MONAL